MNNSGRISPDTRARVLRIAAELNYHPRTVGRTATMLRNGAILVLCDETHVPSLLADPFYGPVLAGIERQAQARGFQLLVKSVKAGDPPALDPLTKNKKGRIDGLLLVGADLSPKLISAAERQGLPAVMVDDHSSDQRADAVVTDNAGGAGAAVRHLITKGHRRIGFVGGPLRHSSLAERLQGYRLALHEAGIEPDPAWVATDERICGPEEGEALALRLLGSSRGRVTAIVAGNDMIAVGVLKAARSLGLTVPGELGVIGFDDIDYASYTTPPLTTVRVFKEETGRSAIDRLLERMDQPSRPPVRLALLTELVVRESA